MALNVVTDGAMSTSKTDSEYTAKQLTAMRHKEQRLAAEIAQAPVIQINYPSAAVMNLMGDTKKDETISVLSSMFKAMPKMKTIYGHNPIDKHPTHLGVLSVQTSALRQSGADKNIDNMYGMKVWGGLDAIPDDQREIFMVTEAQDVEHGDMKKIKEMIDVYESQIIGQNRDYSIGTLAEAQGNAAFATNPHDNSTPIGAWLGVDLTQYVKKAGTQLSDMATDIIEKMKEVRVRNAKKYGEVKDEPKQEKPWTTRVEVRDSMKR